MTLDQAREHIGAAVTYNNGPKAEDGVITSVSDQFVFVRYRGSLHANGIATPPELLSLISASAT